MQKLRQILLFLKRGYSERAIVKQTGISRQTVHQYARLFLETGSDYNALLTLSDHQLHSIIEGNKPEKEQVRDTRKSQFLDQIDYFVLELKRVGVTRQLLWQEYLEAHPSGFQYSRFCELLDIETGRKKPSMHFSHNPAELMAIDFAGSKLHYVDKKSGEIIECPVLIGVLPFSGYAYVEALDNASLPQVIKGLNNMLNYLGGVALNAISDNMRQWVSKSCRYEPTFPQMLEQWSIHNHIGLLATRPSFPKDKPSVENQVLITYRRVYALIRNTTFHSRTELNNAILQKLEEHHRQNFQKKTYSRYQLFNSEENPLLQHLPQTPYELRHYTRGKVHKNYYVVVGEDWHFYSVPSTYVGKEVQIVYDSDCVEIYHRQERIALHKRSFKKHAYTTEWEHMPENHKRIAEPQRRTAKRMESGILPQKGL